MEYGSFVAGGSPDTLMLPYSKFHGNFVTGGPEEQGEAVAVAAERTKGLYRGRRSRSGGKVLLFLARNEVMVL